jgi:hypothetical protein
LFALLADFIFRALPSFSVTTHSFALPASNKPINVALDRCSDMTFSKTTQKKSKWKDLQKNHAAELIDNIVGEAFFIGFVKF